MKRWEVKANNLLNRSLKPVPQELNELDWKSELSTNNDKLAKHISAFSNYEDGGFLVFGINDSGVPVGLSNKDYSEIIKKLGNIARHILEPEVCLDHCIKEVGSIPILIIYIPESMQKPVYIKRKSIHEAYIRSAGQTRKMKKHEIRLSISKSRDIKFEEEIAVYKLTTDEILNKIDFVRYFELSNQSLPENKNAILNKLCSERIITSSNEYYNITNLGAILFAKNLGDFEKLVRKAMRVVIYDGDNRLKTIKEQQVTKGYANGFEGIVKYINDQLPTNEVIEQALRKNVKVYPEIAVRELVANCIIHQDFDVIGAGPMVEIFSDRIEITNPGRPLINTLRFIDFPPQSRNEILASFMRRLNICEERGSGIDKVITWVEVFQLPAPDFKVIENNLKAILYAPRPLSKMDKEDRIRACYQHCCLKYISGSEKMSNSSLRERFNISDSNYPMASRIIADTTEAEFIKLADPKSKSKKYAFYVPFWA